MGHDLVICFFYLVLDPDISLEKFNDELQTREKNLYAGIEYKLQTPSSLCEAECRQFPSLNDRIIGAPQMEANCSYPVDHNTPNSETPLWLCNISNICFVTDYDPTTNNLTSPFSYMKNEIQKHRMHCAACFLNSLSTTPSSK